MNLKMVYTRSETSSLNFSFRFSDRLTEGGDLVLNPDKYLGYNYE